MISETEIMNSPAIRQALPYQPPYLMLDRVECGESDGQLRAIKNVSAAEIFFGGHFPNHPVLPGVLQLDGIFQLGVLAAMKDAKRPAGMPVLKKIERLKFRKPVLPGSQLLIEVHASPGEGGDIQIDGVVYCGPDKSCEGKLLIGFSQEFELPVDNTVFQGCSKYLQDSDSAGSLDINEICEKIPHRFPFLLIDRVVSQEQCEDGSSIMIGLKNVTTNEPYSLSTFENFSFLTGSLQMEVMAQVGCVHMMIQPENKNKLIYFMSIDHAVFHRRIVPGDQLIVRAQSAVLKQRFGKATGTMYVDDELVSEAQFKFALQDL